MAIIPLFILPWFKINISCGILAGYLLIRYFILKQSEKSKNNLNRNRILTLTINVLILGLSASPLLNLQFAEWILAANEWFNEIFLMEDASVNWLDLHTVLFGLFMVLNESNIVIRFTLEKLDLAPLSNDHEEIDDRQFRTGRVIPGTNICIPVYFTEPVYRHRFYHCS